jgi:membrane peptidoglycan carboxypeptidase
LAAWRIIVQKKLGKSQNNKNRGRSIKGKIKVGLQLLVFVILLAIVALMFYFYMEYGRTILDLQKEAKQKVRTSTEDTFKSSQTSLVYDMEGNLISALKAEKDVYYIDYEDIPKAAIDAMVVSEDRKFFQHNGVDYLANIRAAIALIKHKGEITQGASTITQQVARNIFLSHKVTYERKIEEIFAAQELEKIYSKTDIMEFYLNGIYFANGHYGIQAAALGYFSEGVNTLSLSQIVFLCAIPNNPNLYNPTSNIDNTIKRRDRILEQLLEEGAITEEEYKEALQEEIKLNQEKSDRKNYVETYTYYSAIRALMKANGFEFRSQFNSKKEQEAYEEEYYDLYYRYQKELYTHGYRIYTSIDLSKQELLQKSVDKALSGFKDINDEGIYQMQGAAVCIDNDSGRVVSIVGGREQESKGYTLNRGYQSFRQPGSAIKPLIVYTPAFEREYTPESVVVDKKMEDGPKNSGGNYLGKMKLQRAIELSKNTVAWKLFEEVTPRVGLSYLLNMNFSKISESDYVPAASLGGLTIGVSPVEMAAAYATLENDGYFRVPTCIIKIMDSEGNEIVGDEIETKQIYQMKASRIMTEALIGVIKKGTAQGLGLKNTISAGKTGTTNDKKDGWFVGYSPYYTTSVWVGYDMPKTVNDLSGSSYPGTIWHNFMEEIHNSSMKKEFELYDWRTEWKAKLEEEKRQKELKKAQEIALEEEQENEELEEPIVNVEPDNDTENTGEEDAETVIDENNEETVNEPSEEDDYEGVSEEEVSEDDTGEVNPSDEGAQTDGGTQTEEGSQSEEGTQSEEGKQTEENIKSQELIGE